MKRKKILFVNGHMKYGGIEKSLLDILRNFNYNKYEVDLLLIEGKGDYFSEIPAEVNVIFKDLTNTEGNFFKSVLTSIFKKDFLSFSARIIFFGRKYFDPNILKLLKVPLLGIKKYDFAIAYRPGICTDLIQFAVDSKKKATWWHHGEVKLSEKQLQEFEQTCFTLQNIVVVSVATEKSLLKCLPSIKELITVIPNMIDCKYLKAMAVQVIPDYNRKKLHFVTSCRIAEEKHVENIIYASELLVKSGFINFAWHILGDGLRLGYMKDLAEQHKVTQYVVFEGKKANPYPFIFYADLYISTSYVESQGLSILEAMALGTPCIITNNIGIRDYANEKNAVIVEQNFESLTEGILKLVNDKKKYGQLKIETRCPDKFMVRHIMPKIENFLN